MSTFTEAKQEFDQKYRKSSILPRSLVPVDGKIVENVRIRNEKGEPLEEFYKWQCIYALIHSGLYANLRSYEYERQAVCRAIEAEDPGMNSSQEIFAHGVHIK